VALRISGGFFVFLKFFFLLEEAEHLSSVLMVSPWVVLDLGLGNQILSKLGPPLINRDGVSDRLRRRPRRVRKFAALHPGIFKRRHRIHRIKQPQEPDSSHRSAERLAEGHHEVKQEFFLGLLLFCALLPDLPLLERLPSETGHFFVAGGEETDVVEHLGKEARRVGAAAEAEEVDVISRRVITHQELHRWSTPLNTPSYEILTHFVPTHNMVSEACADRCIFGLGVGAFEPRQFTRMRQGRRRNVSAYARLIIMKLAVVAPVEHAEYLEDVGVGISARELVSGAIEAEDKFLSSTAV
jgi:hypothetical protein